MEEMANAFIEKLIQTHINAIADLYSVLPEELEFTFLVALKVVLDNLLPTLSDHDRELYDDILEASETTVIQTKMIIPVETDDDD